MGRHIVKLQHIYSFIDYNNTIIKHNRIQYRAFCSRCGGDRGYKRPNKFNRICVKCHGSDCIKIMQQSEYTLKRSCSMKGKIPWNKRRSSQHVKVRHNISSLVHKRLKKRNTSKCGESFFKVIGYNFDDLIKHLESKFQLGMTWDNYGKWHIDHIIPDSRFDYDSMYCDAFKNSWSLGNLQPLWADDNLKKSDK